jgi:hypothetical protein
MKSSRPSSRPVAHASRSVAGVSRWVIILRAVGLPLAEVRTLAQRYALRGAAEFVREDTLTAGETAPSLIEAPSADARLHDQRPQLPAP